MQKVCLIIRDGWGLGDGGAHDMVAAAATPFHDLIRHKYPKCVLQTSGEAVGLPAGFMGSSEVGHLNLGAGRVVVQELKRINDSLENGEFFAGKNWQKAMQIWTEKNSTLHFLGLLQDEGVHAHMAHLFALMRQARKENPSGKIVVHPFLDGRDTAPRSCQNYIFELEKVCEETNAKIGTVMGRYFAMDRGKTWALTDQAYNTLVHATAPRLAKIAEVIETAYADENLTDEYVEPCVLGDYVGMAHDDVVIHTNYRQDRATQLTEAFIEADYAGQIDRKNVHYFGFTKYYDGFENYLLSAMGGEGGMENLLGEVWSKNGLKQLRIAETQKIKHVSSFFDGKATTPFAGEDIVEIESDLDASTFAFHPEMEAYKVTEKFLELYKNYDCAVINFANCDMVGHTGSEEATRKAVEITDECVGKLVEDLLANDWEILITSDHGNAEEMQNPVTKLVQTSHSKNDVEMIFVSQNATGKTLQNGSLCDVAPTLLALQNIPQPAEMTGKNLIKS